MRHPTPTPPAPEQESVWSYPRPPRVEVTDKRVRVIFNGETIADSTRTQRVLETSHPPTYYIPPEDVRMELLEARRRQSFCEFKGQASYYSLQVGDRRLEDVAWTYPAPSAGFDAIRDHIAFYAGPMDACYVNDERVTPQPGGLYGGWITRDVAGPFKGGPGTMGW